jgi:hypothetical protein
MVVVQHKAVPVLLALIRSCNRSVHHQKVIASALTVLLNLARYLETVFMVFNVQPLVETLAELMQVYRTVPSLFLPAVRIMLYFARIPECRQSIRSNRVLTKMFVKIHEILTHKLSIEERYGTKTKIPSSKQNTISPLQQCCSTVEKLLSRLATNT